MTAAITEPPEVELDGTDNEETPGEGTKPEVLAETTTMTPEVVPETTTLAPEVTEDETPVDGECSQKQCQTLKNMAQTWDPTTLHNDLKKAREAMLGPFKTD